MPIKQFRVQHITFLMGVICVVETVPYLEQQLIYNLCNHINHSCLVSMSYCMQFVFLCTKRMGVELKLE